MDKPTNFNGLQFNMPKNRSNVIKVIGVGGGGGNAVNHMFLKNIEGVDFVICNTDAQALNNSPIPTKLQLGANLTEGLGAGANPEVGAESALESIEAIEEMIGDKAKMVFITVGMGGGTGTGAAPIIAKIAKEKGLLTVAVVTTPFSFEGNTRNSQAQEGIKKLSEQVDSIIVINNNKLRDVYGNLGFKSGFSKADEVLSTAAMGIAKVITLHYLQNIDFRDANTVLKDSGSAIMGSATAQGENRAQEAIIKALDSPLLNDNKIVGAKNVLLLILSGDNEITLDEIGEINDFIRSEAKSDVNIIMGIGEEDGLGDGVSVTIIATGFNKEQQTQISKVENKKVIFTLSDDAKTKTKFSYDKPKSKDIFSEQTPKNEVDESSKITHQLGEGKAKPLSLFDIDATDFGIDKKKVIVDEVKQESGFFGANFSKQLAKTENTVKADNLVEFTLVPTTEIIKNIHVIYDEVITDEPISLNTEDFMINDKVTIDEPLNLIDDQEFVITNALADIEVIDMELVQPNIIEEQAQTAIVFDMPITQHLTKETIENEVNDEIKIVSNLDQAKKIDVIDTEIVLKNTTYNLEDYMELENKLLDAKPKEKIKTVVDVEPALRLETKMIDNSNNNDVSDGVEISTNESEKQEISPLNNTINELTSRTDSRRITMKKHNHRFKENVQKNIDELESEPAYKRNNVLLDDSPIGESNISRTSLNTDGKGINFRSNNSFLHDNVD